MDAAFEVVRGGASRRVLLSCEHASARLPPPWTWPEADTWVVGTHWAYDIGAEALARELAASLGAVAVLSRFSRLLVDPNRDESAPDLYRTVAEGRPIELNRDLSVEEREARLDRFYRPYHRALDRELGASDAATLLAVHSFTPEYEGHVRTVEIGVLFDGPHQPQAVQLQQVLERAGFVTALNEPYSGIDGMIYAADRHGRAHARIPLEIEVRQDLAVRPEVRRRIAEALSASL